jgi:hypothetical protein
LKWKKRPLASAWGFFILALEIEASLLLNMTRLAPHQGVIGDHALQYFTDGGYQTFMGEIKSALELAMERSKKYAISDEERGKFKEKEILQQAMSLFHRHQESHLPLHEIVRELDRMDEKTRKKVKEILHSLWLDVLSLDRDSDRSFSALESIQGQDFHEERQTFQNLLAAYHEEMEKARQGVYLQLAEALKREGIEGDAVEPNLEGNREWKSILDSIHRSYQGRLEEVKQSLNAL